MLPSPKSLEIWLRAASSALDFSGVIFDFDCIGVGDLVGEGENNFSAASLFSLGIFCLRFSAIASRMVDSGLVSVAVFILGKLERIRNQ